MAYIRYPFYAYQDGENIHIHAGDAPYTHGDLILPLEMFDLLVVMRYAQLTEEQERKAEQNAVLMGEFGADPLRRKLGVPAQIDAALHVTEPES